MRIKTPKDVHTIASLFKENGFECYLVGGGVRDQILGIDAKDYDLATNALPEDVMKIFYKVIPTGIKHGTVTIIFKKEPYEVTTYRVDGKYSDGRRPDSIHYTSSIEEDLKRRDFTINSIGYDILAKKIFDPNNGMGDLKKGIIRAIGTPEERFNEDGLRSIRACRFAAQLNFVLSQETMDGIKKTLHRIAPLSKERIYDELVKIMKTSSPSISFYLFKKTGILPIILPELADCIGVEQKGRHKYDLFEHSLIACDAAPADNLTLRFAALFHDLGKIKVKEEDHINQTVHFHNHEKHSVEIAETIMLRYKFPKSLMKEILHLIKHHMYHYTPNWSDAAVRRFIARIGKENLYNFFSLRQADSYAHKKQTGDNYIMEEFKKRVDDVLSDAHALSLKDLAVNGHILIEQAQIPRGPLLGSIMELLLEAVLEDPAQNNKETLVTLARNYYKEYK